MAGSARRIVIEFLGKDTSLGRTAGDLEGRTGRLGTRMRAVGKIAAVSLAAGAVLAAKGLYSMTKNAAEDEAAQRRLAIALKNTTGANKSQVAGVERWISAQGRALGVTDDKLRPALQRFVNVTGDVAKAQQLASLAMDVSAGSGKSLETVSAALARAQNGNLTGLARLGIATKDASGETLSLDQVMKNAAKTYKGQAAGAANSLEGKMGRLKLIMDETKEAIGARLIPIVTKLADWFLTKAMPAISQVTAFMREKLGPVVERIRSIFSGATNGMSGDVSRNLNAIRSTFQSVVSIVTSLWARFGGTLVSFATTFFTSLKNITGGALQVIAGVFKVFAALLKGDWANVWAGIKQILSGAWAIIKSLVSVGWAAIKGIFSIAGSALKGIFSGIWGGIKAVARAGAEGLVNLIRGIPGKLRAMAGSFGNAGKSLINAFVNGMKNAAGIVKGIAGNVWTAVKGMLNGAINKINAALEFRIDTPGPGGITINPPNIPRLAKGAIVKRRPGGIIANIGEGKYDEGVFPLGPDGLPMGMSPSGAGGGGIIEVHTHVYLDTKEIYTGLRRYRRELGRPLGLEG